MTFSLGYHASDNLGVTAIVIDDDKDTATLLSEFLEIKGISVIATGYSGPEAIAIYNNLRPDVVFLDVMMEGHDGIYTLEKIREIQSDVIIIMITADMTKKTRDRLIELNASSIIYKPYDINEVMDTLNKLVLKLKQELTATIMTQKTLLKEMNLILKKKLQNLQISSTYHVNNTMKIDPTIKNLENRKLNLVD